MDDLDAASIRTIRGSRSRAAFAALVGVTPHTIYRWELPEGAKEARRPREKERARLLAVARGEPMSEASVPSVKGAPHSTTEQLRAMETRLHRMFGVGHEAAYEELLSGPPHSLEERVLSAAGLSLHASLRHFDGERALVALRPVLSHEWSVGTLPAVDEWVSGAAAILHALPQRRLFDLEKVQEHAASAVRAADSVGSPVGRLLAAIALNAAGVTCGDESMLEHAFRLLARTNRAELPELMAAHMDEIHAFRMLLRGETTAARAQLQVVAEAAERLACRPLEARALGSLAARHLDDLAEPETALALAARARRAAERGRLGGGIHDAFIARAELEANLRRGALSDAMASIERLDRSTEETGFPPFPALTALGRVLLFSGRYDELETRAAAIRSGAAEAVFPIADAHATYMDALAIYGRGGNTGLLLATFIEAEGKAARWRLLLREVLIYGTGALLACERFDDAELALRRTQRILDRLPSPWAIAHLRRLEGTVLAARGDWAMARPHLEAAVAAFEVARDEVDAALARWLLSSLAAMNGEPFAGEESVESRRAAFGLLGMKIPAAVETGVDRQRSLRELAHKKAQEEPHTAAAQTANATEALLALAHVPAARLVVPIARLTVRGIDRLLVERELLTVLSDLLAPRLFRFEEIDSAGTPLSGHGAQLPEVASWVEFGDGVGRRLRIGTAGAVDAETRAMMTVLASVGSLALEVATLRGLGVLGSAARASEEDPDSTDFPDEFVAHSKVMRKLRREVLTVAASRATVVVTGESGSGKEVIARALHQTSPRRLSPFVTFNCATVPRDLFEGQLFGYKRGAFTGATSDHPGVIRAADGGTLFLDEIGELPLDVQPKLLRFLENQEVLPLGASRAAPVDVRVVAATHRDLGALVRAGTFREDLFFRLQVIALHVPPLRERREDILPLAHLFLERFTGRAHPVLLGDDAAARLLRHDYAGNVRELRNIIERTLAYAPGAPVIHADMLHLD